MRRFPGLGAPGLIVWAPGVYADRLALRAGAKTFNACRLCDHTGGIRWWRGL